MGVPKRKNDISVYRTKELTERRQELLDSITESDTFLPDSILHDDLDMGMLEFVKENLKVISDGEQIPIIPKILTIQRWGEIKNNWSFADVDGNIKVPFIGIIRKPDVQPGTNPSIQRTIPDRRDFYYSTIKTWNGSQIGADVYKIPQPVAVDISFEVTIVCHKFRDLNRFNKMVLQKFSSRQSYTMVKGHYIPIVLDRIVDSSPIDSLDGRKFYVQNYELTMLGFLLDSDEFDVKPAISRMLVMTEFITSPNVVIRPIEPVNPHEGSVIIKTATYTAEGQSVFSVGESICQLFFVTVNGDIQELGVNYFHIGSTSKITFPTPPVVGSIIMILYSPCGHDKFYNVFGTPIFFETENFIYNGSTLTFNLTHKVDSIIYLVINGLVEILNSAYSVSIDGMSVTLLNTPVNPSSISICYAY
jgi:hypothetical protein